MATHSSILAWRIPWAEETGGLQSMGVARSQTQLKPLGTGVVLSLRNWTNIKSIVLGSVEPGTTFKLWVLGQITLPVWVSIPLFFKIGISSVQSSSVAQSCLTLCNPVNRSTPGLPVHHQLREFIHTHVYQVGDAIQPCHSLSSPSPPAPNPSQHQGLFQWVNSSHQMAKVLEFQLQPISPPIEHPGLISFRMDWLDLLAVQGTLKSFLQHHSSKASIFQCSAFFTVQLSHPYMTTGKTIALTRWTFVGKVMSLLFNMLYRLFITFLSSFQFSLWFELMFHHLCLPRLGWTLGHCWERGLFFALQAWPHLECLSQTLLSFP